MSVSVESVPFFSMVTVLPLTSLAKIEQGCYKVLRGCGMGNRGDRMKISFNKGSFLNAEVTGQCPVHRSSKGHLKSDKQRYQHFGAGNLGKVIETTQKAE